MINLIMVSYHRPNDLINSVQSIIENTTIDYHLSIIDNSSGSIDHTLDELSNNKHITIYRNKYNIGKGKSFKQWYDVITNNDKSKYIISIDADIKVPKNWLEVYLSEAEEIDKIQELGALAPIITEHGITKQQQLDSKQFRMHVVDEINYITKTTFYNYNTAGSLFLINKEFYESFGGYPGDRLYGNDDAYVCLQSKNQNRFIGITTAFSVEHLHADSTKDYALWKMKHITDTTVNIGHWDSI